MAKRQLVREYFAAFSNRDLNKLSEMFDDNVQLKDWEIDITGKESVMEHNSKFFDNIESLDIKINRMGKISEDYIMADITVTIDNNIVVEVEDRITFNQHNKITRVKAYKK